LKTQKCAYWGNVFHPAWKRPPPRRFIDNKNSIAYRKALVSSGRFDPMKALNTKSEGDIAAGDLLITESGGKVTEHKGNQLIYNLKNISKKSIIGTGEGLHDKIIERVEEIKL
jgi:Archaeal fructose-1,6-bisphosphatase and related enzymes of inositol monophosphatase family